MLVKFLFPTDCGTASNAYDDFVDSSLSKACFINSPVPYVVACSIQLLWL